MLALTVALLAAVGGAGCGFVSETPQPEAGPTLDLRGEWTRYSGLSAPLPETTGAMGAGRAAESDAGSAEDRGTPVALPGVVADFMEGPAGQWQLFCRALPAQFAERIRAGEALVWHTGHTSDVARFYLNTTLLGAIGSPPPEYESGHMRARLLALPHTALRSGSSSRSPDDQLCMALWSAEGFRAAVRSPGMQLGAHSLIYADHYLERVSLRVLLGIYVTIGGYHLFLFLRRRDQYHDLYFAVLCLLVSAYFFLASPAFRDYLAGPLATLRLKLEFCLLATLAPVALCFVERVLRERHPPFAGWLLGLAVLAWLIILPSAVKTIHYSLLLIHSTMLVTLGYTLYRIAREALRGNRDARLLLMATACFVIAVLHDVLVAHVILRTPPIASLAFAVLLPAIAVLLANRVVRLHESVAAAQRDLEQRVRERTVDLEEARERAEEANRAKSRFLASMSHEIRTPLQAMLGAADLIGNSDSPEERQSLARLLSHAGENLSTLVEDTLDHARIEADRMQLREASLSLHELLRDTIAMLEPRARKKNLAFDLHIAPDVPEQILGDPGRLSQILLNLLGNALKFTETGGIELRARRTMDEAEPGRAAQLLVLQVVDTGPGIPPTDQERIFRAFEQVKDFMARREGGVGLGLAISSRLVALMNGALQLESPPAGRSTGSCFTVRLPLRLPEGLPGPMLERRESSQPELLAPDLADEVGTTLSDPASRPTSPLTADNEPAEPRRESSGTAPTMLVAEDNPDIRGLLELYLRKTNWQFEFAEDGRVALEIIRRAQQENRSFDLYVFDMQMPRLDGERLTRILRRRERLHRLRPVVILAFTAHAMDLEREAILAAGCDEVLAKPVVRSEFLATIDRLRQRKS